MGLKFVSTPVKRRIPRKSALLRADKPRRVIQDYAIDEFGELPARKKEAERIARHLGHDLLSWHQRSNDPAGRWNAYCACCNLMAIVCTEPPANIPWIYGHALTEECAVVKA